MKRATVFILILFITGSFLISQNYYKKNSNYPRYFNPDTVVNIEGKIIGIDSIRMKTFTAVRLNVQAKSGPIYVHIAPYWYLEKNKIIFKIGDLIKIRGSKIIYDDKPTIIASEITYNNKKLKLRDENGFPLWAGQNNDKRGKGKGKGSGRGQGKGRGRWNHF